MNIFDKADLVCDAIMKECAFDVSYNDTDDMIIFECEYHDISIKRRVSKYLFDDSDYLDKITSMIYNVLYKEVMLHIFYM